MEANRNIDGVFRLTALWAFSECALGGIMHALKLPFTGLTVGGFAVLCIGLLAHVSGRDAGAVLRATVLVLLVKAAVSPHSPPAAYLAVGFQGALGTLLLCVWRPGMLAPYLFAFLAMLESVFQKLLMLLIFFGKPLFEAFDLFVSDVLKGFNLQTSYSASSVVVGLYVTVYALGGLLLGYWLKVLPGQLDKRAAEYAGLVLPGVAPAQRVEKTGKTGKWFQTALVLLFIVLTFLFSGGKASGVQKAVYAFWRTVAVLAGWYFIVRPVSRYLLNRWISRHSESNRPQLRRILEFLPTLESQAAPLYKVVSKRYRGWRRVREFVIALFSIVLYAPSEETSAPTVGTQLDVP